MAKQKKNIPDITFGESALGHHPFDRLKGLFPAGKIPPAAFVPEAAPTKNEAPAGPPTEEQIFSEAMQGVRPIPGKKAAMQNAAMKLPAQDGCIPENEALSRLARLVDRGEGFVVSDTPEYMEGTGYHARREVALRLHRGDFSIQGHIDLHGMNVETAREAFESFMKSSYLAGKGAVLVIHGRGLSSPGEAVLKNKVREWLGHSYWRKRVLAYASAQSHDGGAGATYVLLRDRPVSKRSGKKK
ncbi:MAG: DNA mismatch repair protein MutS [Deltaproteobacteria bacterium]|nr:DNA mismatch repair protein MutS [Deltaproteobacteria bacterium]